MRKSLRDIQQMEAYLQGRLSPVEQTQLQTQLLIHPALYEDMKAQQLVYLLVRDSGRQQLKAELEDIHDSLIQDQAKRSWWEGIKRTFNLNH